jgi:MoaA/NifB/PqqE/SkfB family radical SAM enzyme
MEKKNNLDLKYKFSAEYFDSAEKLKQQIINKTVIPHQVEFQPGPSGKKICWLSCEYCYGESAINTDERPSKERLIDIINQIADGGVKKVTFAGWATDPLNSKYIDDLLEVAIKRKLIFGFNTKALKVSEKFINLMKENDIQRDSWISLSVDSGYNNSFNLVHGVKNSNVDLYDRLLKNVFNISKTNKPFRKFDISAAYLINKYNSSKEEISKFINDFRDAGCNILRFSFAQPPRGKVSQKLDTVPTYEERKDFLSRLSEFIIKEDSDECKCIIIDPDKEHDIFYKDRSLPCVARFVYPTVGFDGRLYQCSQSAAPNFKKMELGDLKKSNFWDLYYDYDVKNFKNFFNQSGKLMNELGCRCDRKEHIVNKKIKASGLF